MKHQIQQFDASCVCLQSTKVSSTLKISSVFGSIRQLLFYIKQFISQSEKRFSIVYRIIFTELNNFYKQYAISPPVCFAHMKQVRR